LSYRIVKDEVMCFWDAFCMLRRLLMITTVCWIRPTSATTTTSTMSFKSLCQLDATTHGIVGAEWY